LVTLSDSLDAIVFDISSVWRNLYHLALADALHKEHATYEERSGMAFSQHLY